MEREQPMLRHEFVLELFVQGQSVQSNAALELVRSVCEARLAGRYSLEVIDIQQQPERTRDADIVAAPALLRRWPEPMLWTVGRFSEARVLQGLGLADAGKRVKREQGLDGTCG